MNDDYYRRQQKRGDDGIWLLIRVATWVAVGVVSWHWVVWLVGG